MNRRSRYLSALMALVLEMGCFQSASLGVRRSEASDPDASADAGDLAPSVDVPDAGAPVDVASEGARSGLCGNGVPDPGETCDTCPADLRLMAETANELDDNCSGVVDEGFRVPLTRIHCSLVRQGCAAGDWDHCFALPEQQIHTCFNGMLSGGNVICERDRMADDPATRLFIYALSVGGGARSVRVGGSLLSLLHACFDGGNTRHQYVTGDDAVAALQSWNYSCQPMGYVRAWSSGPRPGMVAVYSHLHPAVTSFEYSRLAVEGPPEPVCLAPINSPAWYAWPD